MAALAACALAAVPAAAPAVVAASSAGSEANGSPAAHGAARRAGKQSRHVAGWALLGPRERVGGGLVEVWTIKGRSLLTRGAGRSSASGTFFVAVRSLPKTYVVSVRGGRVGRWRMRGTMGVVVRNGKAGDKLHVTPLTTLIAARVGLHRSVPRAEREIRTLLRIPHWQDLYGDARIDARYFDGGRFVRAAHERGGLDRYVTRIGRQVGRGTVTFRGATQARASALITPYDLAMAAAGGAGKQTAGWILRAIGLDKDPNTEVLEAMRRQLDQINQQLVAVRRQLDDLAVQIAQGTYDELAATAGFLWIGGPTDSVKRNLDWVVERTLDCRRAGRSDCSAGMPRGVAPLAWCERGQGRDDSGIADATCSALSRLAVVVRSNGYDEFQSKIVSVGTRSGVLGAFQKLELAKARNAGFLTTRYRDDVAQLTNTYAWVTALLSVYGAEHARALLFDDAEATAVATNGADAVKSQLASVPRALPADSVFELDTGRLWTLVPNPAKRCGQTPTNSPWLWWRGGDKHVTGAAACGQQLDTALARLNGAGSYVLPNSDQLTQFASRWTARRPTPTLGEWMEKTLRLPDLSALDGAYPVPPPDTKNIHNAHLAEVTGDYWGNNGTSAGLMANNCEGINWGTGMKIKLWSKWYPMLVHGIFCPYTRLDTAAVHKQCTADFQWSGVEWDHGMPCQTPVSRRRMIWRTTIVETYLYPSNGPIDYGHPLAVMAYRTLAADDRFHP